MADASKTGLVDLEKELICSICTEVLYQPLTLLDCLHTFCGACLKEWFSWQAANASHSRSNTSPYTCPSCRAAVRSTRPNATVTTLLDILITQNPEKGRSEAEKAEMAQKYKPGDDVIPKIQRRTETREERRAQEEDQRLVQEVREWSLGNVATQGGNFLDTRERRREDRSREQGGRSARSRDSSRTRRPGGDTQTNLDIERRRTDARQRAAAVPERQIEHQASLRSLISNSDADADTAELEEEIVRQILEEGVLEGIDLNNLTPAQEEEISDRIARLYRRRRRERARASEHRRNTSEGTTSTPSTRPEDATRQRAHTRTETATSNTQSSRPPVSRPYLFDSGTTEPRRHHRRSSSQGSGHQPTRGDQSRNESSTDVSRAAARSATDLSQTPQTDETRRERRRRLSQTDRRITDPESTARPSESWMRNAPTTSSSANNSPRRPTFGSDAQQAPPLLNSPPQSPPTTSSAQFGARDTQALVPENVTDGRPRSSGRSSTTTRPTLYSEPSISCNRCGTPNLQYTVHYNCHLCDDGAFNLCLRCYRTGKGCLHWFGFGRGAMRLYERQALGGGQPPNQEPPHTLTGRRWLKPRNQSQHTAEALAEGRPIMTDDNPARRLQQGLFCEICNTFANACYWSCESCNEGAWGFCNNCVNQGRCCTHPLLPVAHTAVVKAARNRSDPASIRTPESPTDDLSHPAVTTFLPTSRPPSSAFTPLTFRTICNICTYPIPSTHTRFHCPQCTSTLPVPSDHPDAPHPKGDYDICTSCYHTLVSSGRISKENGPTGWRRCLNGHRMIVVGYEDREGGRRRIVVGPLVGGVKLKDADIPPSAVSGSGLPPAASANGPAPTWSWHDTDGTIRKAAPSARYQEIMQSFPLSTFSQPAGLRVQALWGYWPAEGVRDELMFPKGADITEAEDINGDWFWGVYAGAGGLFPGNYGRVV